MTVKELIERLATYPEDMEVYIGADCDFWKVGDVDVDNVFSGASSVSVILTP